jgi:3-oxoadipate enol-lactonase
MGNFVNVDRKGSRIFYEADKGDPPLVYLHGFGVNHTIFSNQRRYFCDKGFGSVALDLRGCGKSSFFTNEESYTLERHVSDLEAVLQDANVRNGTFIGYSIGAMIAEKFAAEHPERVDGLVLISTSYNFAKSYARNILKRFFLASSPLIRKLLQTYNLVTTPLLSRNRHHDSDFGDGSFEDTNYLLRFLKLYSSSSIRHARVLDSFGKAVLKWTIEEDVSKIQAPTLVMQGDSDGAVPIATAFELSEMISKCEAPVILKGVCHNPLFNAPQLVTRHIEDFLQGIYNQNS